MDISETPSHKKVVYTPPASEQIEAYSRQVCQALGDEFSTPEVIQGFTHFMQVTVKIMLRHLNEEGFDNAAKEE